MRRFSALSVVLSFTFSLAAPAHDYLSEAERYLRNYNGPSTVDREALRRNAQLELDRLCAADADCPLSVGRGVVKTYAAAFADKHTNLKDPSVARRARAEMRGDNIRRVGLRLVPAAGAGAVIGYVRPESPAARAGLTEGTLVTAINGLPPTAANLATVEDFGTVNLELVSGVVTVLAEELAARDYPTLRVVNGVNVVNIPSFLGEGVARGFFDTLRRVSPDEPLVIDVRANGGGSLNECMLSASAFGEARHRLVRERGDVEYVARFGELYANNRRHATLDPVAVAPANRVSVLVSNRTASCGEVFAGAMQSLGATVLGTPTAGVKNSAVGLYDLSDGSMLSVTTSKATTAGGQLLDAAVQPNRLVNSSVAELRAGRDPVLDAALSLVLAPSATR